ncbi:MULTISPECIES: cytochrome c peroxidase [Methylococcus]|uniref:cytochrome c peroxidase n=1 Tax=Methylococcus TaxID=413 RepID=UPI001C530A72|nr:cytochrome c peroxidase [Methylococcus capsulatus]QXP89768.1 SCO family protein [Methylococcus capsulatus]
MNLVPLSCRLLACLLPALLSAAPVLAGGLAPGYRNLPFSAPEPGSYELPVLGTAADGVVLDSDGRPLRLHALYDGRIVLFGFIYSTCDDVNGCPLATVVFQKLRNALKSEPEPAGRLRLLTLSFDPEHDTPEAMRRYGEGFRDGGVDWHFLTTRSEAELQPILEAYGQSVQKEYDAAGRSTGKYSHLLRVFLIDGQKRIRNVYTVSVLHPDLVLADVKTLLQEVPVPVGGQAASPPLRAGDDKTGYASPAYETHALALDARRGRPADLFQRAQRPVLGLPKLPVPADDPLTPAKIALGRKLFYDRRLSLNQTFSCAMCHIPEQGFTSQEQATATGIEGRTVRRNAPTLYNVAYLTKLFHDGRESSLENQVWGPFLAANEMGNPSVGFVLDRIESLPDYRGLFEQAFGRGPGMETVGQALACYERVLVSGDSPFDRWRYGHESGALSEAARKGFELFTGKAGCAACHTVGDRHALFTDDALHNTGVGYRASMDKTPAARRVQVAPGVSFEVDAKTFAQVAGPVPGDLGRYEITQNPADRWKYRTPTLRNVALTAPYMHNGVFASLREVVEFYNRGGEPNENLDPLIRPLGLSAQEVDALVEFLSSLTGGDNQTLVSDAFAAPVGNGR